MRLSCPQCHTEYDVPDAALAKAKNLRCANCGTIFTPIAAPAPKPPPAPPAPAIQAAEFDATPAATDQPMAEAALPDPVAALPAEPEPETVIPAPITPPPRPAQPRPVQPAPKPGRALGISILLVLLAIAAVLAEHKPISHVWPPSLRLFDALGLH